MFVVVSVFLVSVVSVVLAAPIALYLLLSAAVKSFFFASVILPSFPGGFIFLSGLL